MNYLLALSVVIIALAVAAIVGELLGKVWTIGGTAIGAIYLFSGSTTLASAAPAVSGLLRNLNAIIMNMGGPLTTLFRRTFSNYLPTVLDNYRELVEEMLFTDSASGMLRKIFFAWIESIFMPLLSAFYCNFELMLILIMISAVLSIMKKAKKKAGGVKGGGKH